MPRFFVDNITPEQKTVVLKGQDAKHISLSLRSRVGEKFVLCDGKGTDYFCTVSAITKDDVTFEVNDTQKSQAEPGVNVTLYQALVKSDKFDFVVQKAVELGVSKIVPVCMQNCVSKLDGDAAEKKTERWNKISKEAAMQSGRAVVPVVCPPVTFDKAITDMKACDCSFVCYEKEDSLSISDVLNISGKNAKTFAFLVGPEGGISSREVDKTKDSNCLTVGLGKRILRTETAPLCVLTSIMYFSGNLA